jgi:hypothetical protein
MEDYIYDPYGPPKKKRKKRNKPRLDYSDPKVQMWMNLLRFKHPELFPLALTNLIATRNLEHNLLISNQSSLIITPEMPKLTGKNITKEEWDAWLCYYCIMQDMGIVITPQEIADLTGRSLTTVNSAFKAAERRIQKLDAKSFTSQYRAEYEKQLED